MRADNFPFVKFVDEKFVNGMLPYEYVVTFPYPGTKIQGQVADLVYKDYQNIAYALRIMKYEEKYYLAGREGKMLTREYDVLAEAIGEGVIEALGNKYSPMIRNVFHVNIVEGIN